MFLAWWNSLSPALQILIGVGAGYIVPEILLGIATNSFGILTKSIWNGYKTLIKQTELTRKAILGQGKLGAYWKDKKTNPVELRLEERLDKQWGNGQVNLNVLNSILSNSNPAMILGEPGAGKTIMLAVWEKNIAKQSFWKVLLVWLFLIVPMLACLAKYPELTLIWAVVFFMWEPLILGRTLMPVFIEARSAFLEGDTLSNIENIIKTHAGEKLIYGGRWQIVLFIDGINEIQTNRFTSFSESMRQVLSDAPFKKVIFTSRLSEDYSSQMGIKNVYRVSSLSNDEVEKILVLYKSDKQTNYSLSDARTDFSDLENQGFLEQNSVGRNTFWLEMIATAGQVYSNRAMLIEHYANTLLAREQEKPVDRRRQKEWQSVPVEVEMNALGVVALEMNQRKVFGILGEANVNEVASTLQEHFQVEPYRPWSVFWEADAATILNFRYKNLLEFRHPLLQEFFAAQRLKSSEQWHFITENADNFWWWTTFIMLIRQSEHREKIISFILQNNKQSFRAVLLSLGLMSKIQEEDLYEGKVLDEINALRGAQGDALADWTTWNTIEFHKFLSSDSRLKTDLLTALSDTLKDGVTSQHKSDFINSFRIFGTSLIDYCGSLVFRWGRLSPEDESISSKLPESIIELVSGVDHPQASSLILFATLNTRTREQSLRFLSEMGDTGIQTVIDAVKNSAADIHNTSRILLIYGDAAVPFIETALPQIENITRIDLFKVLVDISSPLALDAVERIITNEEDFIILGLYADYVTKLEYSITFPWFLKLIKSDNVFIKALASNFLKKEPERSVKAIIELINNGALNILDLLFIGDLLSMPDLQSIIAQNISLEKPDNFMQNFVLSGISANENIPYDEFLEKLKNSTTAPQAINLFSMIGKSAISHLLPLLDISVDANIRGNALEAIRRICFQESIDIPELTLAIVKNFLDPNPEIQSRVSQILPFTGNFVQPFVSPLVVSEDDNLRVLAFKISNAMLYRSDSKIYYHYLESGLYDANEGIRELCFQYLVVSGNLGVFKSIARNLPKRGFRKSIIVLRVYLLRIFQANYHAKIIARQIQMQRKNRAYTTCMKVIQNKVFIPAFQNNNKSTSFTLDLIMKESDLCVTPIVMRNAIKRFAKERFNQRVNIEKIKYIANKKDPLQDIWIIEFNERSRMFREASVE